MTLRSKVATFLKGLLRIKLDDYSWLQTVGRESYCYCERGRRFRFYCDVIGKNAVELLFDEDLQWACDGAMRPVSEDEKEAIFPKLVGYFARVWGSCAIGKPVGDPFK